MMHRRRFLVGVWLLASAAVAAAPSPPRVTIFVGPQTRDGFTDVDAGVREAIKDVQAELKKSPRFTLAPTAASAQVTLLVVGRRTVGTNGSVGVPVGNLGVFLPINRRAIDTVLRVGTYEKALTSEDEDHDQWRAAARQVVRDVTAWLDVNQGAIDAAAPR